MRERGADTSLRYKFEEVVMGSQRGFSLIELLIVLSIISIVSGYFVLNFFNLNAAVEKSDVLQQFEYDLRRARAEAAGEGARGILKLAANGHSYTVGIDRPPYSSAPIQADTVLYTRKIPTHFTLTLGQTIVFDSRGFLIDTNGNMTTVAYSLSGSEVTSISGQVTALGAVS